MAAFTKVDNSSFLDLYGSGFASAQQQAAIETPTDNFAAAVASLFTPNLGTGSAPTVALASSYAGSDLSITVAVVLDRATDVAPLLKMDWGERQKHLADLGDNVWATYGADKDNYTSVKAGLAVALGGADTFQSAISAAGDAGYVSSVDNRTIWLTLSPDQFHAIFDRDLYAVGIPGTTSYQGLVWQGDLSLPSIVADKIEGFFVDQELPVPNPAVIDATEVAPVTLDGTDALGVGNHGEWAHLPSSAYADSYDFPHIHDADTPAVAVVDSYSPVNSTNLLEGYNAYRSAIDLDQVTSDQFRVDGDSPDGSIVDETALDISVVASAAPRSTQVIYASSAGVYQQYQNAFFSKAGVDTPVLTSSWGMYAQPAAGSPFETVYEDLFVDGLLANTSVHIAGGDLGSSGYGSNGTSNAIPMNAPTWALAVGGTSLSNMAAARTDATLQSQLDAVTSATPDLAMLFGMVAAGLKKLPSHLLKHPDADVLNLFETVWNSYTYTSSGQYLAFGNNYASAGGISTAMSRPDYQSDFGLTYDGRSMPDVSALAGGNSYYKVLNYDYVNSLNSGVSPLPPVIDPDGETDGGTSAAAPLWAALTANFDAVFEDQKLPDLGFYNDLLYQAAVIAPGSFNDITLGNNISSYYGTSTDTGYYTVDSAGVSVWITPTGQGYQAGTGYDLATGLGSPNGVLLGRALTAIAHQQMSFSDLPDMLVGDDKEGWSSGTNQTVMLQGKVGGAPGTTTSIEVTAGSDSVSFTTTASGSYAWTDRFAQQAMQEDFDRRLVRTFDRQSQGTVAQVTMATGDSVSVTIDSDDATAPQAKLSSSFGFADFTTAGDDGGTVRLALPVSIAETVDGKDDQTAIVRLRDNGRAQVAVTFYRVDDLNGDIEGVAPGQAGYAALAQQRAYQTGEGGTSITNPSKGNWKETTLLDVDAGDLVAMWLDNTTRNHQFWAFSQANEVVGGQNVGHLWNYGLNTYGWEESFGGGDHDYNDLTVQLDFTSAYGKGYLAQG